MNLRFLQHSVETYDHDSELLYRALVEMFAERGGVPLECFIGIAARLICEVMGTPNFDSEIDIDDTMTVVDAEVLRLMTQRGMLSGS